MKKLTHLLVVVVLLLTRQGGAQATSSVLELHGLRAYVREVLTSNAALHARTLDQDAAIERIAPAGALPDPMLTTGITALPIPSFDPNRERMTQIPIGIQQRFPFPGKQGALTDVARADSVVSGASVSTEKARLVVEATRVYLELSYAESAVRLWRRRVTLADQAVEVAQVRYQTGAAPQTDLLRARLRRAELEEQGQQLQAAVTGAVARVNALRGGADDTLTAPVLLSPDGKPLVGADVDSSGDLQALTARLDHGNPDLLAALAAVQRARRRARVFDIAARPEFMVAVQPGIRFGGKQPFLTALIGVSVPLWKGRKQAPAARAAHLDVDASNARLEDLKAQTVGKLRVLMASLDAGRARIDRTVTDILPLADAATVSALQRYRVGDLAFNTVLDTQDDLFRAQLRLLRIITDYGTDRARLAALVGEEWYQ